MLVFATKAAQMALMAAASEGVATRMFMLHDEVGGVAGLNEGATWPDGFGMANSAPKTSKPSAPDTHSAPAPHRSRHKPNSQGEEAWANRAEPW